jgi:hypothetical protein
MKAILLAAVVSVITATTASTAEFLATSCDPMMNVRPTQECLHREKREQGLARTLYLTGEIGRGDYERFRAIMTENSGIGTLELWSPGGDVDEAEKIGRLVRKLKLATRSSFSGKLGDQECATEKNIFGPKHKCSCASACFLIWTAGVDRYGSHLGLHNLRYSDKEYMDKVTKDEYQKAYTSSAQDFRSYLREMEVPEFYINQALSTSAYELREVDPRNGIEHLDLLRVPSWTEVLDEACHGDATCKQQELRKRQKEAWIAEFKNQAADPGMSPSEFCDAKCFDAIADGGRLGLGAQTCLNTCMKQECGKVVIGRPAHWCQNHPLQ